MAPATKRRHWSLHWGTWLALAVVTAGLVWRQFEPLGVGAVGSAILTFQTHYGWPLVHGVHSETWIDIVGWSPTSENEWFLWQLAGNALIGLLLVAATLVVVESWLRRERRWQLTVRDLLMLTAVVAVLVALGRGWALQSERVDFESGQWPLFAWEDLARPLRWPVILALAATLYALGSFIIWLVRRMTQWCANLTGGGR